MPDDTEKNQINSATKVVSFSSISFQNLSVHTDKKSFECYLHIIFHFFIELSPIFYNSDRLMICGTHLHCSGTGNKIDKSIGKTF